MQFVPYLNFDGNCAEAIALYAQLFGGKIVHQMHFGEMPPNEDMPPLSEAAKQRIMHAQLQVGDQTIMASDALPVEPAHTSDSCAGAYRKPQGLWVSIGVESQAEGQRVFDGLAQGGQISMPFMATFWSPGFGMVTDRFGTPWMVDVQLPQAD